MVPGYDKVANFIATDPCMSIYPRFSKANAKNLLYLQAEISLVLHELGFNAEMDFESGDPDKELFPVSVRALKMFRSEDGKMCRQWEKTLELRQLLKEYNDCLLQQRQMMQVPVPNNHDIELFKDWLKREAGGRGFLRAIEIDPWRADDFVSLKDRDESADWLTSLIHQKFIPWYHGKRNYSGGKPDPEMGIYEYSDKTIKIVVGVICVIVSAVLPATSMFLLSRCRELAWRFVVIFVYNVAFSAALAFLVKSRRVEIFAATTAFAAVQATFVGAAAPVVVSHQG